MIKIFIRNAFILFVSLCTVIFCKQNILTPVLYAQTDIFKDSSFSLSPLFQDNMILQQRTKVTFWGKGIYKDTPTNTRTTPKETLKIFIFYLITTSFSLLLPKTSGVYISSALVAGRQ